MCKLLFVFLFILCGVTNAYHRKEFNTLHGNEDPPDRPPKTLIFNAGDNELSATIRQKRATENVTKKQTEDNRIVTKVSQFL